MRRSLLIPLSCIAAALAMAATAATATQLVRVVPRDKADFLRLMEAAPEMRDRGAAYLDEAIELPLAPERVDRLRALGFDLDLVAHDLEAFYASRLSRTSDFGAYHTYTEAIHAMDSLAALRPEIMTPKFSIGTTLEGRPIWMYKISDNPGIDEDEPEIFFNAYIHAREPISFEVLFDLARRLLDGYGTEHRISNIVNTREIYLQPVVNPDGVEYNVLTDPLGGGMWRKNRRDNLDGSFGVDLNRNFGYMWGYDDEGSSPNGASETYRGTAAFSEPEISAMRDFVESKEFTICLNYHSYGGYDLFAMGYENIHIEDNDAFLALAGRRRAISGYDSGTAWEMLYRTNGGANDWMYGEQTTKPKIFAYTTEVGTSSDGFWPAESRIPALCAENLEGNLRMCELADNPYRALPPGPSEVASPDSVPPDFVLTWGEPRPDQDNPATRWNVIRGTDLVVGADNLEGANRNRWTEDGWSWSTTRYHSSSHSFHGGNTSNVNNTLLSKRGHRVRPGEVLRFWTYYRLENHYDYGYVELATDARHFTPIPGSITTNNDPYGRNLGNGITGNQTSWVQASFDLSAYEGEVIWLRFRYNSDGWTNYDGWFVDDIEPADLFVNETVVATGLTAPELSFVDHPSGSFHFAVQAIDREGDAAPWGPPREIDVMELSGIAAEPGSEHRWGGLALDGPNPFTHSTVLRSVVPASAPAGAPLLLSIYDPAGRRTADLLGGRVGDGVKAGDEVRAAWRPRALPAGIYIARLTIGSQVSDRKLVYLGRSLP